LGNPGINYWEKEATLEAQTRLENLQELTNLAVQYSQESSSSRLEDFLAHIALYTDLDSLVEREDAVTLMTVHSAKGLEFPIVFLVGMEEGIFPHWRSAASSCYVAITRAQSRVYFSWARQRMTFGVRSAQTPSAFLAEIPPEFFGEKPSQKSLPDLEKGSLVWHRSWGEGVIRSWEGEGEDAIVTIFFPTVGEKRLILRYAPLTFPH
jgi:DNA helicase-2/ATP-dependent DNA helicase PcrA